MKKNTLLFLFTVFLLGLYSSTSWAQVEDFDAEDIGGTTFVFDGVLFNASGSFEIENFSDFSCAGGTAPPNRFLGVGSSNISDIAGSITPNDPVITFELNPSSTMCVWTGNGNAASNSVIRFTGTLTDNSTISEDINVNTPSNTQFATINFSSATWSGQEIKSLAVEIVSGANYVSIDNLNFSAVNNTEIAFEDFTGETVGERSFTTNTGFEFTMTGDLFVSEYTNFGCTGNSEPTDVNRIMDTQYAQNGGSSGSIGVIAPVNSNVVFELATDVGQCVWPGTQDGDGLASNAVMRFIGTKPDNTTIQEDITMSSLGFSSFSTFVFSSAIWEGEDLKSLELEIRSGMDYFAMDNINFARVAIPSVTPEVTLTASATSAGENGGSITLTATANSAVSGDLTVPLTFTGSATSGTDYTGAGDITIMNGNTTGTVTLNFTSDDIYEPGNETITATINATTISGATVGSPSAQTLTITDDDSQPTISINDVSKLEGLAGTTNFTFTVSLSNASNEAITVDYATADGTARSNSNDYTAASGSLTFNAGETSKTIDVIVRGETLDENDETFTVNLSSPTNATINDGTGLGTITNDDTAFEPSVELLAEAFDAAEGGYEEISLNNITLQEGGADINVVAELDAASGKTVTVPLSFSGTASASDYVIDSDAGNNTIELDAGDTKSFSGIGFFFIEAADDDLIEGDETIIIDMGDPTNAEEDGTQQLTVTINDTDAATVSIADVTMNETDAGITTFTFTVTVNTGGATIPNGFMVDYATSNGTATAGSDYTSASGTLNFSGSSNEQETFTVTVAGDEVVEANETFTVTLSNIQTVNNEDITFSDATATGTITNDDQATVTIADVAVDENDGTATVTLTLDNAVDGGFAVDVSTADNTATTADGDYTSVTNATETFAGTASEQETLTITLGGDTKVEADELIDIAMSNLVPSTVDATDIDITDDAQITITNDDQATVTIANESGNEDDGAVTFTATLDVDVDGGFDVDVSTSDGTATTADTDYTAVTNQTLSFSGSAGEAETFTVTPTSDTEVESDETVTISMSNVSAAKVDDGDIDTSDNATLTITNDDEITFSVNDPDVTEGDAGTATLTFTVSLSDPAPPGGATVDYATSDGTASNASDYTAIGTTTLSFSVGEETKTVDVAVNGDEMVEADETITLTLSNPTGTDVAIGDATGSGTITNDDQATVTIADVAVDENDGTATVTLTLDNAVDGGFAVDVSTSDGTASTADSDYTAVTNATETFAGSASETETLTVTLGGDTKVEADETIGLAMSNLVPSTVDAADIDITDDAQITITNDDQATVTIANESGNEDDGAITVTVTLDVAVDGGFDVDVSTSDGTATIADTGYTSVINQTLSFSGNASETKTFTVTPTSDAVIESDETVTVSMSGLAPVIVAGTDIDIADNATVTITNDDVDNTSPTVSISSTAASPTNTAPIPVTVQFSESVTGFIEGDLTVSGGAVSGFTGSGDSYSFNLAPSGNGTLTVGVAANVAQDGAGNNNTAASQFSIVYDNIAPTVTLSSTSTDPTYTSPIPVTVTFSEEMAGFAEGDLSVSGGTVSGFSTSDNTVFTFDLTPTLEAGTLTVDIGGSVATDLAGNPNPAATQLSRLYDALGASTCEVQWHRGEGVAIAANAVTKNSGDNAWGTAGASSLQRLPANTDGGIRWTLSTTGVYALGLNTSDNGQSRSSGYLFRVTNGVLFSEQALSASPITGTTSLGAFTNGQVASIRREGTDINFYLDGSLVHTIAGASQAELVADLSIRTDGVPIGPVTANFCDLPPTATITSDAAGDPTDSPFTATFTFSQDVAGFEITDIVPSNAVLDNFAGSGDTYTVDVYPNQNGTVTLAIPQAAANAAAGGLPSAPASFSIEYGGSCDLEWGSIVGASNTAGTITKNTGDGDWGTSGATSLKVIPAGQDGYLSWPLSTQVTYTVGLSTDPAAQSNRTGYAIRVVNLTAFAEQAFPGQAITGTTGLGAFASGDVATIRRQGTDILFFIGGQLRHTIPNADQGELLANLSIRSDGASAGPFSGTLCLPAVPTVAIAADAKAPSREAFTATVTFSEAVTGFEQADIQATNATLSAFAGSGDTYTVTVTPAASGNLSLSIPQGAASDAQGTPTQASQAFTLSYDLPCSIAWENITGASESAGVLTKTAAGDSWNAAGASSQNVLPAGMDGYISWTLSSDTDVYSMGLATRDKDQSIRTGFALRVVQGSLFAEVDGPAGGSTALGSFSQGQQAQIAREGNSIRFYLDGMPVHTMTAYQGNLVVDLSINTQNTSVGPVGTSFCNIGRDVAWGAPTGASVSNGSVTETAGTGQYGDSGAPAMNILPAGTDGWVSWELKRGLNHKYSIGIIPSSSLGGGAALPMQGYEFRQNNNGLYVYVDNTLAATVTTGGIAGFGPQVVIRRAGSDVLFFYDGQLVHTAPNAFQDQMGIGLALKQPGMSISGVRTSFDPAGPPPRLGAVRKSKELDEASSIEGLSLYPNPAQGVVNIMMSAQEGQTAHIAIYNALGQMVSQADLQAGGSEAIAFKADLADMPNGLYMVRVAIEGKLLQKSFVKR